MTFSLRLKLISLFTIITQLMMAVGVAHSAAPPNIVTYQGRVLNANGVPVSDSSLSMKFYLYSALTSGTCLWSNSSADCDSDTPGSTTAQTVTLTDGLFTENLGDTGDSYAAISAAYFGDDTSVFLEVDIAGETLTPRKQITAAPYAINAQLLDGIDSANFLQYDGDTATGVYDFTGAVFSGASPIVFEGATADDFETTFAFTDPTADRTITFPDSSGTFVTTGDTGTVTGTMVAADTLDFDDFADALSLDASSTVTQDGAETFAIVNSGTANTIINLSSTGDFVINDNGSTYATFSDAGAITLAASQASSFTTAAGDLSLISSAASVVVRGVEAAADAILLDANNNAAGGIDIDSGTGGIIADTTGAISLDGAAASNVTTSVGALTIETSEDGSANSLSLISDDDSADAIVLNASDAAGGIDVNLGTGGFAVDQVGSGTGISLDAASASNFTTSAGAITISSGAALNLDSSGTITTNATSFLADGALTIESTTSSALTLNSGSTGTINLGTDTDAETINLGTGGGVKFVTLGSTTSTSGTSIDAGDGDLTITSADDITMNGGSAGSIINIGTNADGNVFNIGTNNAAADDINIGSALDDIDITGASAIVAGTADVLTITANAASTWSATIGDLTIGATDTGDAGSYDLILNAGDSPPSTIVNGNDIELSAEGDTFVNLSAAGGFIVSSTGTVPSADIATISNAGQASVTDGVNALQVSFSAADSSGDVINVTPTFSDSNGDAAGETWNIIDVVAFTATMAADAGGTISSTLNGISFGNLTESIGGDESINSTAVLVGTGWDVGLGLSDSVSASIGNMLDFTVGHNGTDTVLFNSTGDLYFRNDTANDVIISSGTAAPTAGEDGNDVAIEAEDDIILKSTGTIDLDATGGLTTSSTAFTADAGLTVSSTGAALTLTSATAATWSTTAGNLTVEAAADAANLVLNAGDGAPIPNADGNDVEIGAEDDVLIRGGAGAGASGGLLDLTAGSGDVGLAGGAVQLTGGAAGSAGAGAGGAVTIVGGTAAASNTGVGGAIDIDSGAGGAIGGAGGAVTIDAGDGTAGDLGGAITITSGDGGATGSGGLTTLAAGAAGATSGTGGAVAITAGNSPIEGAGGAVAITSGTGAGAGNGGAITITTGTGAAQGAINLDAGTGGLTTDSTVFTADAGFQITTAAGANEIDLTAGAGSSGLGGKVDINAGAGDGVNAGGAVEINAGVGGMGGAGGAASLVAGAAGANATTANGGAVAITAGAAGTDAGDTGIGGAVTLTGGVGGLDSGVGGAITLQPGASAGTAGVGGGLNLYSGAGSGADTGGAITMTAGLGGLTSGIGGAVAITSGAGGTGGTGNGGAVTITTGSSGTGATGDAGDLALVGANASSIDGRGGHITIDGGNGTGTAAGSMGGNITITAGDAAGASSLAGSVTLATGSDGGGSSEGDIKLTINGANSAGEDGGDIALSALDDLLFLAADDISIAIESESAIINFGDDAYDKTIDIGGVTNDGGDTISIATNATTSDTIVIGNADISTTIAMTGGDDWSVTAGGVATFEFATGTADEALCGVGIDDNGLTGAIEDCKTSVNADYAERYPSAGNVEYGHIVVPGDKVVYTDDEFQGRQEIRQAVLSSTPYQGPIIGIASNNWGDFTSAGGNVAEEDNPMPIALTGRVPVKVVIENGSIEVGDFLTTSSTPGHAMKATKMGRVIGMALEDWNEEDDDVMVQVTNTWYLGNVLGEDGTSTLSTNNIVATELETASAQTSSVDSYGFALRGSSWNGAEAEAVEMIMKNTVTDSDNYRLSISDTTGSEVAYITNEGTMKISGDMIVSGNIYPSDRGSAQTDKYIYYDGSEGPAGDFMRTNAKGWSTGSYDFAEMFPSENALEPGDVVVFSGDGAHVEFAKEGSRNAIAGIVSTRPGFLAGENLEDNYPIALIGRVPTNVNLEGGEIEVGDALTSSSTLGYAKKATEAGQIVGYALEPFTGNTDDKNILVFVNAGYWNGAQESEAPGSNNQTSQVAVSSQASNLNMTGNIFMTGNEILSIGKLEGLSGLWDIDQDGNFKTKGELKLVTESHQGTMVETNVVSSIESEITLSGTSKTSGGSAEIRFEKVSPEYNDVISAVAPIRVIVTPNGPVSLYVEEKDQNHFVVKRFGSKAIEVEFDWIVTAYRKGYEPEDVLEEQMEDDEVVIQEVPESTPEEVVEEAIETTTEETQEETIEETVEELVEEEPQAQEPTTEEPAVTEEDASLESPELELVDDTFGIEGGESAEKPSSEEIETPSPVQEEIVQ